MNNKTIIFAVDDDASIRDLYFYAFKSVDFEPYVFSDGKELRNALLSKTPSLIILDVMLEKEDGFEILSKLRENKGTLSIPVIMVSAKGEELDKVKGLNLGADDYISKPFGVIELIARVNAVLRRFQSKNDCLFFAKIKIDNSAHEIYIDGIKQNFTLKEYNLLKLLIENKGKVVKRDDILLSVWGEDYFGETRTLDMHVASLRKAIENSGLQIITVRGVGYKII